jgi:hypothetical protein
MEAAIKIHKVLPIQYKGSKQDYTFYNTLNHQVLEKESECMAKYFGEKPTDKNILDHILPVSSSRPYLTGDELDILNDLEDESFISELNEQFVYQFKSYVNDSIIAQTINDLGLNEKNTPR